MDNKSERTKAREAFFLEFAAAIRHDVPDIPLMVTGGYFRSRGGMENALADGDCDLIGLGWPAVLNPSLPQNTLLNPAVGQDDDNLYVRSIQRPRILQLLGLRAAVGAGVKSVC